MRILAWILLIVGVGLAAGGGTILGPEMTAARAASGPLSLAEAAMHDLDSAHADHTAAMDQLRAGEPDAAEAVDGARVAIDDARTAIADLQAQGILGASPPLSVLALKARTEATPPPVERLTEWLIRGGPWWATGILFVVIGALLERRIVRAASRNPSEGGGAVDFLHTLDQIEAALQAMEPALADLAMDAPSAELRDALDRIQDELITPLVDGRMQLAARHGNSTFSIYFGAFSGAERNLNRVWSALTDGHSVVARESMERAKAGFTEARHGWDRAEASL